MIHLRHREPGKFGHYAAFVSDGWQWGPVKGHNWQKVFAFLKSSDALPVKRGQKVGSAVLIEIAAGKYKPAVVADAKPEPVADPWDSPDAPEITDGMFDG